MIKKIILLLIIVLTACSSESSDDSVNFPLQIKFNGIGSLGIFDPSITLDTSTNTLWMSYTEVHPSVMWPDANPDVASLRLASSTDRGKTWTDAGIYLNQALDVTVITATPAIHEGTWMSEVSQLLYDPWETDASKKWKLIWLHYLRLDHVTLTAAHEDSRRFEHGWIAIKEASGPQGLATATEIKLFAASLYDPENNNTSGNTQSPVGDPPKIFYHTDIDGALNNSAVLTEPGLLVTSDGIYMSIVNIEDNSGIYENKIQLLKYSRSISGMQDSSNWDYLGTMLTEADAVMMGYLKFTATELYESNGNTYVIVSPVSNNPWDGAYNGCMTFRISNLNTAVLEGNPTYVAYIHGDDDSFNGACECHESLSYGFIYGQVYPGEDEMFRIYHSGILP